MGDILVNTRGVYSYVLVSDSVFVYSYVLVSDSFFVYSGVLVSSSVFVCLRVSVSDSVFVFEEMFVCRGEWGWKSVVRVSYLRGDVGVFVYYYILI